MKKLTSAALCVAMALVLLGASLAVSAAPQIGEITVQHHEDSTFLATLTQVQPTIFTARYDSGEMSIVIYYLSPGGTAVFNRDVYVQNDTDSVLIPAGETVRFGDHTGGARGDTLYISDSFGSYFELATLALYTELRELVDQGLYTQGTFEGADMFETRQMIQLDDYTVPAKPCRSIEAVGLTAYNIEGNNYFKLRDIGEAMGFGVRWDGAINTIVIDTSVGYTPQ